MNAIKKGTTFWINHPTYGQVTGTVQADWNAETDTNGGMISVRLDMANPSNPLSPFVYLEHVRNLNIISVP